MTNIFRTFHLSQVSNHPGILEWLSQKSPSSPKPVLYNRMALLLPVTALPFAGQVCTVTAPGIVQGAVQTYLRSLHFLSFSVTYLTGKDSTCQCSIVWQASSSSCVHCREVSTLGSIPKPLRTDGHGHQSFMG